MTSATRSRGRRMLWLVVIAAVASLAAATLLAILKPGSGNSAIRLAYQNRIVDAVCIVAVEKDFFEADGLRVEAMRFNSGPACSEAMISGSADVGTMGDTAAVILASRRAPFTIIASHGAGEHRHRLMVRADSPLRQPGDLRGRTVAVKKGTSTYGGLLAHLAANDINPSEVRIIDMDPSEMPDALLAGSIDAFVASEPTPSLAEMRGVRELATMGGLGNSYPVLLVARNGLLAARPSDVRRFLCVLRRAEQFVRDHPDEAAELLAKATGLSMDVARRAMRWHSFKLQLDAETIAGLTKTAEFLKEQGQIDSLPDFNCAANADYLPPAR